MKSPKSQPAAVGRAGDHPETPAASTGAPASRGPLLPLLPPSMEPAAASAKPLGVLGFHMPLPLSHHTQSKHTPQLCAQPSDTVTLNQEQQVEGLRDISSDGE